MNRHRRPPARTPAASPVAGWDDADPATRSVLAAGLPALAPLGARLGAVPAWLAQAALPAAELHVALVDASAHGDRRSLAEAARRIDARAAAASDSASAYLAALIRTLGGGDAQAGLALLVLIRQGTTAWAADQPGGAASRYAAFVSGVCQLVPPATGDDLADWLGGLRDTTNPARRCTELLTLAGTLIAAARTVRHAAITADSVRDGLRTAAGP